MTIRTAAPSLFSPESILDEAADPAPVPAGGVAVADADAPDEVDAAGAAGGAVDVAPEPEDEAAAEPAGPEPSGFHVLQHVMDGKLALSVGVPGLTDVDVETECAVLIYEFLIDSDERARTLPDGNVLVSRYSAGLTIQVTVKNIEASFSLNLATIAAAASVDLAESALKVRTKGLPQAAGALATLPPVGALNDAGGLEDVVDYIEAVKSYIADHPDEVTLERHTAVLGRRAADTREEALSVVFAMKMIERGRSLYQALDEAADRRVDPDLVRQVYRRVLRSYVENPEPDDDDRDRAGDWLDVG